MSGSLAPFSVEDVGRGVWPRIPAQPVREFDGNDELVGNYVVVWSSGLGQLAAIRGDGARLDESLLRLRWGGVVEEMRESYLKHERETIEDAEFMCRTSLQYQPGAQWSRR